jgi:hypothetical protein
MSKTEIVELRERLDALEAAVATIGHNGGPPFDDPPPPTHEDEGKPVLIPDRRAAERYDVSVRTLARWDETSGLGFPPPVYIRDRRYRELAKLEEWDRANARKVVESHSPHRAVAQALPRGSAGRFSKPRTIEAR